LRFPSTRKAFISFWGFREITDTSIDLTFFDYWSILTAVTFADSPTGARQKRRNEFRSIRAILRSLERMDNSYRSSTLHHGAAWIVAQQKAFYAGLRAAGLAGA
jgi:hypothetical protein